ncbi:MAG TPA: hypothetical protein VFI62_15730, partial [Burkholderiales bacterium]|nr:hypothetical protein [Burkholderiales bacterium]
LHPPASTTPAKTLFDPLSAHITIALWFRVFSIFDLKSCPRSQLSSVIVVSTVALPPKKEAISACKKKPGKNPRGPSWLPYSCPA